MKKLRIYLATQENCVPCKKTKEVLGIENNKGGILGVPIHEVDLTANPERSYQMGVTDTPTLFIVEAEDSNQNDIWEETEEVYVWHHTGLINNTSTIETYINILKNGGRISTPL